MVKLCLLLPVTHELTFAEHQSVHSASLRVGDRTLLPPETVWSRLGLSIRKSMSVGHHPCPSSQALTSGAAENSLTLCLWQPSQAWGQPSWSPESSVLRGHVSEAFAFLKHANPSLGTPSFSVFWRVAARKEYSAPGEHTRWEEVKEGPIHFLFMR